MNEYERYVRHFERIKAAVPGPLVRAAASSVYAEFVNGVLEVTSYTDREKLAKIDAINQAYRDVMEP